MYLLYVTGALPPVGFPIRKSPGQSLFSGSPKLIAAYHVLHRLSLPRHPPYALSSLTIKKLNLVKSAVALRLWRTLLPCIHPKQLAPFRVFYLQIIRYAIVKEQLNCPPSLDAFAFASAATVGQFFRLRGKIGGGERDRTDDPLRARQVLSQLSYTPNYLVGLGGLEPPTSRLSVVCSSQLSYRPLYHDETESHLSLAVIANHSFQNFREQKVRSACASRAWSFKTK